MYVCYIPIIPIRTLCCRMEQLGRIMEELERIMEQLGRINEQLEVGGIIKHVRRD